MIGLRFLDKYVKRKKIFCSNFKVNKCTNSGPESNKCILEKNSIKSHRDYRNKPTRTGKQALIYAGMIYLALTTFMKGADF
jgi:hypothetical protein